MSYEGFFFFLVNGILWFEKQICEVLLLKNVFEKAEGANL